MSQPPGTFTSQEDTKLSAMLHAFAGPEHPIGARGRAGVPSRRPRWLAMVIAACVLLIAAVPALALRSTLSQSISDFLGGDAPPQAKAAIAPLIAASLPPGLSKLDSIDLTLSTTGPEGDVQLYTLHWANGDVGSTIVDASNNPPLVGGSNGGPQRALTPGQVFDVRFWADTDHGHRPVYFSGITDPTVARVELLSPGGQQQAVTIGNGSMLGWVSPQGDGSYGDAELLAEDAMGRTIGRIDVCDIGPSHDVEFRPHVATMPTDLEAACAVPPTPDPG